MEGEGDGDGEDENGEDGENEKEGFESLAPEDAAEEEGEELKEDEQQPQVYLRQSLRPNTTMYIPSLSCVFGHLSCRLVLKMTRWPAWKLVHIVLLCRMLLKCVPIAVLVLSPQRKSSPSG